MRRYGGEAVIASPKLWKGIPVVNFFQAMLGPENIKSTGCMSNMPHTRGVEMDDVGYSEDC